MTRLSDAGGGISTACYSELGDALAVLGRFTGYAQWRRRTGGPEPVPPDVDVPRALASCEHTLHIDPVVEVGSQLPVTSDQSCSPGSPR